MAAPPPTTEALALSASIFTAQIASWIPASFAPAVPPERAEAEWQAVLRSAGEGKERLGLGHPLLNAPKAAGYSAGMQGLEKSLKKGKSAERQREREAERDKGWQPRNDDDESEEEESRSSMLGKKRKGGVMDLLNGKKGKKVKANGNAIHAAARPHALGQAQAQSGAESSTIGTTPDAADRPHAGTLVTPLSSNTAASQPAITSSAQNVAQSTDPVSQSPQSKQGTTLPALSTPTSPVSPAQSQSQSQSAQSASPHPLLLAHDHKLSKNARKKARQRAKKAAAAS